MWKGKQYVVIAAGGHSKLDTKRGDQVIAFSLEDRQNSTVKLLCMHSNTNSRGAIC